MSVSFQSGRGRIKSFLFQAGDDRRTRSFGQNRGSTKRGPELTEEVSSGLKEVAKIGTGQELELARIGTLQELFRVPFF